MSTIGGSGDFGAQNLENMDIDGGIDPSMVVVKMEKNETSNQQSLLQQNHGGRQNIVLKIEPSQDSKAVTQQSLLANFQANQYQAVANQPIGNSGGAVRKVILTKNSSSENATSLLSHGSVNNSPVKTVTISGVQSPQKMKVISTPPKQHVQKLTFSPNKQLVIPSSGFVVKSPKKLVQGQGGQYILSQNASTSGSSGTTATMSPTKVMTIKRPAVQVPSGQQNSVMVPQNNAVKRAGGASVGNLQPVSVSGNKFQYVRLVSAASTANSNSYVNTVSKPASIAPSTGKVHNNLGSSNPMRIPITSKSTTSQVNQRLILPAAPIGKQVPIRPNIAPAAQQTQYAHIQPAASAASLQHLPPGTTIIQSGQNMGGMQGFALVPAQYMAQLQQQYAPNPQPIQPAPIKQEYTPMASSNSAHSYHTNKQAVHSQNILHNGSEAPGIRQRKPCNCTKSQCLKLYCDCFANGEFCSNCNCNNCYNNLEHEEERQRAIKSCLDRNPLAFHPKIGKGKGERRHNKGCNCKRSGCLKNYCECYEAKILCTDLCKCNGCKNFEESPDRKTLMHLADAAEVRVQQQTAAKSKLSSQIQDAPSRAPVNAGERLPYSFVTEEVAEATCSCLIAQAEDAERTRQNELMQERMILEEFGRCLLQVIESAKRTKHDVYE